MSIGPSITRNREDARLPRASPEDTQILRALGLCLRGPLPLPECLKLPHCKTVPCIMAIGIGEDRHAAPCNLIADTHPRAQVGAPVAS
jgi:hypothetical protein